MLTKGSAPLGSPEQCSEGVAHPWKARIMLTALYRDPGRHNIFGSHWIQNLRQRLASPNAAWDGLTLAAVCQSIPASGAQDTGRSAFRSLIDGMGMGIPA